MHGTLGSTRRRLFGLLAAMLVFAAARSSALAQPDLDVQVARVAPFLTVVSSGSLPGFPSADVPSFLSAHMADAPLEAWRFEPISADFTPPADRVEWSFRVDADAPAGPPQKRRFVARQLVFVEVRLYLHGEFQTVAYAQAEMYGGPEDEELTRFVRHMTETLLGTQGAYRAIQAGSRRARDVAAPAAAP